MERPIKLTKGRKGPKVSALRRMRHDPALMIFSKNQSLMKQKTRLDPVQVAFSKSQSLMKLRAQKKSLNPKEKVIGRTMKGSLS